MRRIALVLSLLSAALSWPEARAEEKKWRWGDDASATRQDREAARGANELAKRASASARYEIFENADGGNYPIPGRPHDFRPPVDYQERPDFVGGFRPGRPGGFNSNGFGQSGYGGGGAGILTGPVPSWQREPPYKEFDKCKCTEKFNCPSPGISYGHCDVGKKYCCTQDVLGGPLPSRPHHSIQNGILSGPGGPVDHIPGGGGGRPPFGPGPGYYGGPHQNPGILVGPGGPTGVIGRPPLGPGGEGLYEPRPPHGPGILSGPGGPTGVIGRPGYGNGAGVGVLVGPGGPTGIIGRPPGYGGGHGGLGGRPPGGYGGGFGAGGSGLLVGPGGPFGPGGYGGGFSPSGFGVGRSASPKDHDKLKKD